MLRACFYIHVGNSCDIYSIPPSVPDLWFKTDNKGKWMLDRAKRGIHGTHFVAGAETMSETLECTEAEFYAWRDAYFTAHPAVPAFHERINKQLMRIREVQNIFGYRRYFFDRPWECLPDAIAW